MVADDRGNRCPRTPEKSSDSVEEQRARRTVLVGEPWPGEVEVGVAEVESRKAQTISRLGLVFAGLLVAFFGYAVWNKDTAILEEILQIVRVGLLYIAVWAGGGPALRALSNLQFDKR
jgi:hypothetical protein